MSFRPREAYESAQQFSLHHALGGETSAPTERATGGLSFDLGAVQKMQQTQELQQRAPATVPCVVQAPTGLSLRFASFGPPTERSLQPAASLFTAPQTPIASTPPLTIHSHRPVSSLASNHTAARDAAVMRLTAQVDDVTSKLQKAEHRLVQTEAQLTRTSHVLCHERQASEKTIHSLKHDMGIARDAETKLRTQLATAKKTTLKNSAFLASVDSALATDEQIQAQKRSMAELEASVTALRESKVGLEAQVGALQAERAEVQTALDAVRIEHDASAIEAKAAMAEMSASQAELEQMQKDHGAVATKLASARVEEATAVEAVSALHTTRDVMESENAKVGAATKAMLLEHGDAARALCEVRARVADLEAKEAALSVSIEKAAAAALEPVANAGRRRGSVTGAAAPAHQLCTGLPTENAASQAAHCVREGPDGIAAPLAIDAPIDLALKRVVFVGANHMMVINDPTDPTGGSPAKKPEADDSRTTAMVSAVVGDLKARLTQISMQEPVWRIVAPLA